MNFEFFIMNGFGIYVWSAFAFTFIICLFLYIRTRTTVKKFEKDIIKEANNLSEEQFEDIKKQKVVKAILLS